MLHHTHNKSFFAFCTALGAGVQKPYATGQQETGLIFKVCIPEVPEIKEDQTDKFEPMALSCQPSPTRVHLPFKTWSWLSVNLR